ncbi:hypothetical protein EV363DRAFT_1301083 [Boletus edulis]|nr:hypothetical protein EV363DRAFT_1301083 [Boletus edulis]
MTQPSHQIVQVNHLENTLQSTPQSKGSATISEHISTVGVHVSDIRPWVTKDVENFQECSFDEMLKDFLVDCSDRPQESFDGAHRTRLFKECMNTVFPIYNGEAQGKNQGDIRLSKLKENLVTYSEVHGKHENELYPLFMTVANVALQYLQELEIDDLRPPKDVDDDSSVCFHVHDPSLLKQSHRGKTSDRKPDVVVYLGADSLLEGHVLTKAPDKKLGWRNVRTFVEFKRSTKKMAVPPDRYTLKEITPPQQHEYLRTDVLNDELEPDVLCARPPPTEPVRRCTRQREKAVATNSDSRKRTSEHLEPTSSQSKRQKSEHTKSHPVIVQAGYYAAEMFTAYTARQHIIGVVVVGDVLYVWRYDRERTIQCSGLNFIEDLPRFLALLLAMQRFEAKHWGLNPHVDPKFCLTPSSEETTLRGDEGKMIQVVFGLSDETRVTHFGLNGRATNVLSVECKDLSENPDLVSKLSWMEIRRMSEPDILKKVYEISETDPDVKGHVPEMMWFKTFHDTATAKIRERLGLKTEGTRVLCMIIFRKLRPITEFQGKEFLIAWWVTVRCHHALWKRGVHHRDISPSNLMYRIDKQKQIVAVLNDFDLASTHMIATGTQRTGTVPFMAIALLDEAALQGKIAHVYEYDAESFIWTLIWTALRYANGKWEGDRNHPLDDWLKVGPTGCAEKKAYFLNNHVLRQRLQAAASHEENWKLAQECIVVLRQRGLERAELGNDAPLDTDSAFGRLLRVPTGHYVDTL